MNIFESIREDHDIQRKLADQLVDTSGDTKTREKLFEKFKKELHVHADAEERHFYLPLFKNDMTQDHARHGVAEHHEIDELITELEKTDKSSAGWLTTAKKLREKVYHHLDDEEHTIFQLAGKVLSEHQKNTLASAYRNAMKAEEAGLR